MTSKLMTIWLLIVGRYIGEEREEIGDVVSDAENKTWDASLYAKDIHELRVGICWSSSSVLGCVCRDILTNSILTLPHTKQAQNMAKQICI